MPSIIVLNPGKRKRFLLHEGPITAEAVQNSLEKILGGDAKFKTIKGNKLPELVSMYPTEQSLALDKAPIFEFTKYADFEAEYER